MTEGSHGKKIASGASIVGSATAFSRVLGYIRDMAIAYYFGAGALSDAFFVAFRISNLLRRLVGEGALTSSFIPIFQEERTKRDERDLRGLVSGVFTLFTIILLLLTFGGILFSEYLVALMSPGFLEDPDKFTLTVNLTRLMFPYMIFVGLMAIGMGILNSLRHFTAPALAPVFFNIAIISSILILSPFLDRPVYTLAIGVLIGGVLQVAVMLPWLKKFGFIPGLSFRFGDSAILKIFKLMGPAAFGIGIYQLNIFITLWFASRLAEGSVSFLYYSGRLMELPLGIFGVAITTAALPGLAEYAAKEQWSGFMESLIYALRLVLFLTIPAAVGLIVLSLPVIETLFAHGEFKEGAAGATATALYFYAPGIVPVAIYRILTSAFYSVKDTITPVIVAALTLVINLLFCIILVGPMEHAGLALATTISAVFNMVALLYLLRRKVHVFNGRGLLSSAVKNLAAAFVMALTVYLLFYGTGFDEARGLTGIAYLGGSIAAGVLIYLGFSRLLKVPEVAFLKGFFIKGR